MTTALATLPGPSSGRYRRHTDNRPPVGNMHSEYLHEWPLPAGLKDWDQPHWEIYQFANGQVTIHACRPTEQEVIDGETLGALGSVIVLESISRESIRNGLRLARQLCTCDPTLKLVVSNAALEGIAGIESDIEVCVFTVHLQ